MSGSTPRLPDGLYPFINERLPLAELAMIEVPPELEALLKEQAAKSGLEIIRDAPVELHCHSAAFPEATFLIWWPHGQERMHMLAPAKFRLGRA